MASTEQLKCLEQNKVNYFKSMGVKFNFVKEKE